MRKAVLPFLTLPDEAVEVTPWEIQTSAGAVFDGAGYISEWDNGTDLKIIRNINIDFIKCFSSLCCSEDELALQVLVSVGTGSGSIPVDKWIYRFSIDGSENNVLIELNESGENLADALHLETSVILAGAINNPHSPISPIHEGSIVWQDKLKVRLEGDVSRFPLSETSFEGLLGSEWKDALWYLQVDWSDPDAAFDSSVRLHVNSLKKEFVRRFRNGDSETVHAVMSDVMNQITAGCLKLGDEWVFEVPEPGDVPSLGQVAAYWLDSSFGSVEAARQVFKHSPERFNACLNALAYQERGDK